MSKNYGNDSQLAEIVKYISDTMKFPVMGAGGGFAPIGTEAYFDGQVAPLGWVICDGTELNIADYPDLATYYASHHGASNYYGGNGTTTFATPKRSGMPSNGGVYEKNEHIVGVWQETVDGVLKEKPVYEKRCDAPTVKQGSVIGNIANLQKMVDASGHFRIGASGNHLPIAYGYDGREDVTFYINSANNNITVNTNIANTQDYSLRIRYIKTTDTWQLPQYGHSADGNGIFCVKATVSDAEINAFDVYTPREHQVAWWEEEIDGVWKRKPVYERTVTDTLPGTLNQYKTIATLTDADNVIECITGTLSYTSNIQLIPNPFMYYKFEVSSQAFSIGCNASDILNKPIKATFRYTKSSDEWQTS